MFSEVISFLVFAVSLIGILAFVIAILTSPQLCRSTEDEKIESEESTISSNGSRIQGASFSDHSPTGIHQDHPKPERHDGRV